MISLVAAQIDRLVRTRRRTIALIIERDGSLTVRAPQRAGLNAIEAFIQQKSAWIARTRARLGSRAESPPKQYRDGERFLFLGTEYPLKLVESQQAALRFNEGFTLKRDAQDDAAHHFAEWYREQARQIITERVDHFASQHGFVPRQIKITPARSRWGSCSAAGTLCFSWRLVLAPLDAIDYVVVHELAHLKVRSHSSKFWDVVARILPDSRDQRRWLRENAERLTM